MIQRGNLRCFNSVRSLLAFSAVLGLIWSAAAPVSAQKLPALTQDFKNELPRIAPHEPADAIKTIKTLPGFHIEQVAAEPLVRDPVAMSFDENGRLFVAEMVDYSEQDKEFLGSIRLLEDTNGDGRFDKSTIYADKLSWPTAVTCYDGGIFVGAAPDIFYLKDTDGDGKTDIRKVVFTGFGRSNVQGLFNSFQWTLDNRIQGATSSSGAQVRKAADTTSPPVNLNGRDFAFDPRTLDLTPVSGGAQHGMTFDDWGRKFVCSNSDHIQMVMFEDRYVARNPYLAAPSARVSIAADGPQAEVFRISPVEPWRIVRTRLRVSGAVVGAIEGGGRAAGYFTGATGTTIYRGDAWPAEYRGQAFVGDVGSNIIHRKVLEANGVGLTAKRVDPGVEFVASSDTWFRPAQFANAPDGNLYIADVYREVIEHPASIPPEIKRHLDLTSGRDRGRIYRIVADGFKQPALPHLGKATTAELVATLDHRNGWYRDTAARLLFERQDPAAVAPLTALATNGKLPEGRMHAMYALLGLKALSDAVVLKELSDENPRVREHAVRLAETVAEKSPQIREKLFAMVADPDQRVRYQLAFTLGAIPGHEAALAKLIERDSTDRWMRLAEFSSLGQGGGDVLVDLLSDHKFRETAAGRDAIEQVARQVGMQGKSEDVAKALQTLEALPAEETLVASAVVRGMVDGLAKGSSPLRSQLMAKGGKAEMLLTSLLDASKKTALDSKRSAADRAEAIRTLGLGAFAANRAVLTELIGNQQPQDVQLAALAVIAKASDASVSELLIEAWPTFTPRLRAAASEAIFSRTAWLLAFLDAVDKGDIPASDLETTRVKLLEKHADEKVRERAKSFVAKLHLGRRQDVLDSYKEVLTLKGDAARGKLVFQKICATCHRLENFGNEIGANLASIKNRGADAILLNVLDPNREVNPQYVNYIVVSKDGRTLTGLVAGETATSVTLKRAENATDTILRINIDEMRSTGLSIMPEGLEKQIDKASMADLIAYLLAVK